MQGCDGAEAGGWWDGGRGHPPVCTEQAVTGARPHSLQWPRWGTRVHCMLTILTLCFAYERLWWIWLFMAVHHVHKQNSVYRNYSMWYFYCSINSLLTDCLYINKQLILLCNTCMPACYWFLIVQYCAPIVNPRHVGGLGYSSLPVCLCVRVSVCPCVRVPVCPCVRVSVCLCSVWLTWWFRHHNIICT